MSSDKKAKQDDTKVGLFADDDEERSSFQDRLHVLVPARMHMGFVLRDLRGFFRHARSGHCADGCVWAVFHVELNYFLSNLLLIITGAMALSGQWRDAVFPLSLALVIRAQASANSRYLSLDRVLQRIYDTMGSDFIHAVMQGRAILASAPKGITVEGTSMEDISVKLSKKLKQEFDKTRNDLDAQRQPGESEIDYLIRQANRDFEKRRKEGEGGQPA